MRSRRQLTLACVSVVALDRASAFLARSSSLFDSCSSSTFLTLRRRRSPATLFHDKHGKDAYDDEHGDFLARNQKRTDVRLFLTQRSIQSFIHLLLETRDPHTARWIELNYEAPNLDLFHGTAVFNYTKWRSWDSIFQDMLSKPKEVVVISTKSRGRPSNPYFQDRVVEFEIDIDPVSLVSRIVSVRNQLATEWLKDIDSLISANQMVLESYYDNLASSREAECGTESIDSAQGTNCVDTEHFTAAFSADSRTGAFERRAQTLLNNAIAFDEWASSPLRQRNFDLLLLLATQESVHRVLRRFRGEGGRRLVSFEWFRDFYSSRVVEYFDGSQPMGRADDFLEALLTTPPSMRTTGDKLELVDPLRIAEDLILTRSVVCADWKEAIRDVVPLEHMELRKMILEYQMGRHGRGLESPLLIDQSSISSDGATYYGEFE